MKRLLFALLLTLIASLPANAQQCDDSIRPQVTNLAFSSPHQPAFTLVATGYDCNEATQHLHFLDANGAFSNSMQLQPLSSPTATFGRSCTVKTSSAAMIPECVRTTLDCSICAPNPFAPIGELSCSCLPPFAVPLLDKGAPSMVPRRGQTLFDASLFVDRDRDGVADEIANSANAPLQSLAVQELFRGFFLLSWEDMFPPSNKIGVSSDFNDYVAALELRECRYGGDRFNPESAWDAECIDDCGNARLCSDTSVLKRSTMRLQASLLVDTELGENRTGWTEGGRKFVVTVAASNDLDANQFATLMQEGVAVCPVLRLPWLRARNANETNGRATVLRYGNFFCGLSPSTTSDTPICTGSSVPAQLSVGFGANLHSRACSGNLTDLTMLERSDACGPATLLQTWEVSTDELSADLQDSSLDYEKLSDAQLSSIANQAELDVFVFEGVSNTFQCPTGVNIEFSGFAKGMFKSVNKTTFKSGSMGYQVGSRAR